MKFQFLFQLTLDTPRQHCLIYLEYLNSIGVPVSTQWESGGYYYPTQIAQFGLSHYSKNLTEPEPRRKVLEDGDRDLAHWFTSGPATITRAHDPEVTGVVLQFQTSGEILHPYF